MPDQMQLETIRREIAVSSGGTSSRELREAVVELILRADLRGDLADFGAGTGDLARTAAKLGRFSSITAFDLSERPEDLSPQVTWCAVDLNHPVSLPSNSFDVVSSLGLIEYLENPFAFAREVHRVLRPGGTAILTTPNNESWRSLASMMTRGYFAAFAPMGSNINLTALVRSDFEKFLRFAGFPPPQFHYTRIGMLPKVPLSWQSVSGGLLRGMRYSDDLVVTVRKP